MGSSHTHSAGEDAAGDEEGGEADEAGGEEEGEDGEGGEGEAGEGEGDEEAGEGDEEDDEEDDEEEEGEGEERGGEDDNKQRTSNVDIDARRARIIRQLNDMGMDPESPQTRRAMECYLSRLQSGRAGAYSSSSQSPSTGSSTVLSDDQALPTSASTSNSTSTAVPGNLPPPLRPADERNYPALDRDLQVAIAVDFEQGITQNTVTSGGMPAPECGGSKGGDEDDAGNPTPYPGGDYPPFPRLDGDYGPCEGDYDYNFYNLSRYQGGPPQPGRHTAVDRLTTYRHKDETNFKPLPRGRCAPRLSDHHEDEAAELEINIIMEESGPSESDYSATKKKRQGGGCREEADDNSDDDSGDDDSDEGGSDEGVRRGRGPGPTSGSKAEQKGQQKKVDKGKGRATEPQDANGLPAEHTKVSHEKPGGRPSKPEDDEVQRLADSVMSAASKIAEKYNKPLESIMKRVGLKLPGMTRGPSTWNLFQQAQSQEGTRGEGMQ